MNKEIEVTRRSECEMPNGNPGVCADALKESETSLASKLENLRYIPNQVTKIKPVAIFPTREIPDCASAIRDWGQGAEELGFGAVLIYCHTARTMRPDGNNRYTVDDPFHAPPVVLTALAMATQKIDLMTGVLVLPLLQTPDVATNIAEIANLSEGRMLLGVGVGANDQEYAGFGKANVFPIRGKRLKQQVDDLRTLWRGDLVDHSDDGKKLRDPYGINPLPRYKIPIWMGGWADPVLARIAKQADGWMPMGNPEDVADGIDYLRDQLVLNGKDPFAFPIMGAMGRTYSLDGSEERPATTKADWSNSIQAAIYMGESHVAHGTMQHGHGINVNEHLTELREWMGVFQDCQPLPKEGVIFEKLNLYV